MKWPRWLQSAAPRLCWEAWLPSYRISRATDALVLEDAERLIAGWNERQEKRMQMLYSPTIGAAILARYWFLWVLSSVPEYQRNRPTHTRSAPRRSSRRYLAAHAGQTLPSPSSCRGPASPMKCARSTGGACLGNSAIQWSMDCRSPTKSAT